MQTKALSSNISFSSNLTMGKVEALRQDNDFASRLKGILNPQDKDKNHVEDAKLRQACQDLEAVFLNMMLKQMRATVPKTNLTGSNNNIDDIYQSMLDTEMTKDMSKAGGIGLADMMYKQLSPEKSGITKSPSKRPVQQALE